jgi:hypothetical protein
MHVDNPEMSAYSLCCFGCELAHYCLGELPLQPPIHFKIKLRTFTVAQTVTGLCTLF